MELPHFFSDPNGVAFMNCPGLLIFSRRVSAQHPGVLEIKFRGTLNEAWASNPNEMSGIHTTGWCPPVLSWFISPINYSYIYNKP